MENMKDSPLMTEKERIAHIAMGETNAEINQDFIIGGKHREDLLRDEAANKYNQMVNDALQEDFSWIQKNKQGPVFEYLKT